MANMVRFQINYASASNLGRIVGFDDEGFLKLVRDSTNNFDLERIPMEEVSEVAVTKYRSYGRIFLGSVSALVAVVVAGLGIAGEITGLGVVTIPLFAGAFAYYGISESLTIAIAVTTRDQKYKHTSWQGSYEESLAAAEHLKQWATERHLPIRYEL